MLGNPGNSYWVRNPDLFHMSQVKEIALHLFLTEALPSMARSHQNDQTRCWGQAVLSVVPLREFKGQEKQVRTLPTGLMLRRMPSLVASSRNVLG